MKKQVLGLIAFCVLGAQFSSCAFAKTTYTSPVKIAIKKYKTGNYTGCMQDCQNIVRRDPSNSLAYYYLAMSYAQAGQEAKAISYYSTVLSLTSNTVLKRYAETGIRCLETPDKCKIESGSAAPSDLDIFINTPNKPLSNTVQADILKNNLKTIQNEINTNQNLDSYSFRQFKDYSKKRSQTKSDDKVSQKKPTNDEIVAALQVLKAAGFSPYSQPVPSQQTQDEVVKTPDQAQSAQMQQNSDLEALMLMGNNHQSSNNNAMIDMLPALAAQSKTGESSYSPQMMQAVIMNSMMNNMNFGLNDSNNNNNY